MRYLALAACCTLVSVVQAQPKDAAVAVQETEAVVTVTKVDKEKRTVTFRGPKGGVATLNVPPESQNLDQVKAGQQYKVKYVESVAVAIDKGPAPYASHRDVVTERVVVPVEQDGKLVLRPAWRASSRTEAPVGLWDTWVDADTGKVFGSRDNVLRNR